MAILVTGGAGYIGSHTVLALLERNEQVIVIDNLSNSSRESLNRVAEITGRSAKLYIADLRNREVIKNIFENNDIKSVIHFAGLKSVGDSNRIPLEYYDVNVCGTLTLLQEMVNAGVMNIVFSSSATVYGDPNFVPLTESCPSGQTTNPYGTSKHMVELILSDFVKADPSFKATILRYFNPVGAHSSGKIGENPCGVPSNLLPYITQVAIGKLDCLSIYGNDYPTKDGTGIRDYIHVMDLASGHLAALDDQNKGGNYKIFNLGTGVGYSVLELIETFEKISGVKIKTRISPRRVGDISECWSDSSLAEDILGWKAKHDLKRMIADAWRWQKNNPNGYN